MVAYRLVNNTNIPEPEKARTKIRKKLFGALRTFLHRRPKHAPCKDERKQVAASESTTSNNRKLMKVLVIGLVYVRASNEKAPWMDSKVRTKKQIKILGPLPGKASFTSTKLESGQQKIIKGQASSTEQVSASSSTWTRVLVPENNISIIDHLFAGGPLRRVTHMISTRIRDKQKNMGTYLRVPRPRRVTRVDIN